MTTVKAKTNTVVEYLKCGRPKCIEPECNNPGQHMGRYRKDGSTIYRKQCAAHHALRFKLEGGYRIFKKKLCENIDGRLGFKCTTTILDRCMLDVDHIDKNHRNDNPENLQTLCSCCHNFKTRYFDKLDPVIIKQHLKENTEFFEKDTKSSKQTSLFFQMKNTKN